MEISNSLKKCMTTENTVYAFCQEDSSRCEPAKVMANVQKNMFVLMSKFTDLKAIVEEFPADTSDDFYEQTYQAGLDVGSIVKISLNYQDSKKNKWLLKV